MTTAHLDVIDRSSQQAHVWINDVAEQFGTEDRQLAYRVLRAFLHAVRDRITVEESAQLAAQLPLLVRGIYYDGWRPAATPQTYHDRETFLGRIAAEARLDGPTEASYASEAAMTVLRRHVSEGEIADVLAIMPSELRDLLSPAG
jgi:uncharacterized protein (DUF2267 family)